MGFFNHQTGKYQLYSDADRRIYGEQKREAFSDAWKSKWVTHDKLKSGRNWTDAAIKKYLGEKVSSSSGYMAYSLDRVKSIEKSNKEFRAWWLKRIIKLAKGGKTFTDHFISLFNMWEKVHQEVDVMYILEVKHPRKYGKTAPKPEPVATPKTATTSLLSSMDVRGLLAEKDQWVMALALQHCPFIKKMKTPPVSQFFHEVTVRVPGEDRDRFNRPKPQRRRMDIVSLIKPHYKAWGTDLFSVGIEVKVTKSDLMGDNKWLEYLPYCDYFCFAVPADLLEDTKEKVADFPAVGILSANTGEWYKMPTLYDVAPRHSAEIYKQIAFSR